MKRANTRKTDGKSTVKNILPVVAVSVFGAVALGILVYLYGDLIKLIKTPLQPPIKLTIVNNDGEFAAFSDPLTENAIDGAIRIKNFQIVRNGTTRTYIEKKELEWLLAPGLDIEYSKESYDYYKSGKKDTDGYSIDNMDPKNIRKINGALPEEELSRIKAIILPKIKAIREELWNSYHK